MTTDKAQRKERPIARGVLDYFPDAIAEIAHVSFVGNQQHNPGQEMHWAKDKSPDHADCILRHLIERGTMDTDGQRHSAKAAWRALALLQIELESAAAAAAAPPIDPRTPYLPEQREDDYQRLLNLGCPPQTAHQIVVGTSYIDSNWIERHRYVYVAGPMRGHPQFNFPAFDAARDAFLAKGYNVISPADIDRAAGDVNEADTQYTCTQADFAFRDFWANFFIKKHGHPANGIVLLDGWQKSVGASAEFFLDRWLDLTAYKPDGSHYSADAAKHDFALAHSVMKIFTPEVSPTPKVNPLVFYDGDWDRTDQTRGSAWFYRIRGQESLLVDYATGKERPGLDHAQFVSDINGGKFSRLTDNDDAYVAHRKTR